MKVKFLGAVFAFFLVGCTSSVEVMQSYIGQPIELVMLQNGPPVNVFELGPNRRAFQWQVNRTGSYQVSSPTTAVVYTGSGVATVMGQTTSNVPYSRTCLYTLSATSRQGRWIVDGYQQPAANCMY
jgi:hypothetical protein